MFCSNCGSQMPDGSMFCGKCGANMNQQMPSMRPVSATNNYQKQPKGNTGLFIALIAGGSALVVILILVLVFALGGNKKNTSDELAETETISETTDMSSDESVETEETFVSDDQEEKPHYDLSGLAEVNMAVHSYTPGPKQAGMEWDSGFFYALETPADENTAAGISSCTVSQTRIKDLSTQQFIDFVIYSDHTTGEICKIVSIQPRGEQVLLTDYYYEHGKLNFIFVRQDSAFTPTYATPDIVGERYYFKDDVMVKWRLVTEPNVIEEYGLSVDSSASYPQTDYYSMSEESKANYDATENNLLNKAYFVYNVMNEGHFIGSVSGRVVDTKGKYVPDAVVEIRKKSDDALLYRTTTMDTGAFLLYVYMDQTDCYMTINGGEQYRTITSGDLVLSNDITTLNFERMVLCGIDEVEVDVCFYVYDASTVGDALGGIGGAEVSFRQGVGVKTGEVIASTTAGSDGKVSCKLLPGVYTAEIKKNGFTTMYVDIDTVSSSTASASEAGTIMLASAYLVPRIPMGKTGILLTWEGNEDLDLTIFTPYQDTAGNMARISGYSLSDAYGNQLIADRSNGCELAYIDTANLGSYKVYVGDYTQIQNGNYNSQVLISLNIHIYIIHSDGSIAEYTSPSGVNGVVWEVAEIHGINSYASGRIYADLTGKNYWLSAKGMISSDALLAALNDGKLGGVLENAVHEFTASGYWAPDVNELNRLFGGDPQYYVFFTGINHSSVGCNSECERVTGPDIGLELYDDSGNEIFAYSEDALSDDTYSLFGKRLDFDTVASAALNTADLFPMGDDSNASIYVYNGKRYLIKGEFILQHGLYGEYLNNWCIDQIDAEKAMISADVYYDTWGLLGEEDVFAGRITFSVMSNPESIYDGFSITGCDGFTKADGTWNQ